MKIGFLGGGSLRLLPIIRSCMADAPQNFNNGEIRLIDLHQERSDAVARLIQAAPEFATINNCKVSAPESLEEGLKDLDVLYLTMAARREPTESLSLFHAMKHNYFSSDQLSVNGAFLSLRLGFTILNIARKMEQLCPNALMLIFPNPVAVYSHLVNTFTKIRALGICGGFNNHRYDLTKLCFGKNGCDFGWNVVAAGVNHLSFILRGDYKGKDLYSSIFPDRLNENWKNPVDSMNKDGLAEWQIYSLRMAMDCLYQSYRKYKTLIFSTEADGLAHIFPTETISFMKFRFGTGENYSPDGVAEKVAAAETERYREFIMKSQNPELIDWNHDNSFYGRADTDITIPVLRAVGGIEPMRIVASRPNNGAVKDFSSNASLEYTMDIYKDQFTPVENQYIPSPFKGLITSLSEYQTLLSEAIFRHDPHLFVMALEAYPVNQFSASRKDFFKGMFDLYSDMDSVMFEARKAYGA